MSDLHRELEQTLALAAVAQHAFLVNQLSQHGVIAQDKLKTAVNSLFVTQPKQAEEVFGDKRQVYLGQQVLQELLSGATSAFSTSEVLRYLLALLYLQYKLSSRTDMLDSISKGLEGIRQRYPETDLTERPEALRDLSRLYQATLSRLPFRIQVRGNMQYLQNELVATKVRVLLFAGVRAAVLWRQTGGKRWHLLFRRQMLRDNLTRLQGKPQL
jgi:high frequency lysogenization protein